MMRTIIALAIAALLGLMPGNHLVGESSAEEGYGEQVNQFCPSTPYTIGDCGFCHDSAAARGAFSSGNLCYFCPNDPPCAGGGACAGSAEASVHESPRVDGPSRLLGDLAYFLLPLGAVIGVRIWRRKR